MEIKWCEVNKRYELRKFLRVGKEIKLRSVYSFMAKFKADQLITLFSGFRLATWLLNARNFEAYVFLKEILKYRENKPEVVDRGFWYKA